MTVKQLRAIASCAALLAFTAASQADAAPKSAKAHRDCFYARDVSSYTPVGDTKVNIRVGVKDVYELDLMGACPDIDWTMQIGLQSHGSDWICSPLDADIITKGPIGVQRCPVRQVRKLTPAEVAALPPKQRP